MQTSCIEFYHKQNCLFNLSKLCGLSSKYMIFEILFDFLLNVRNQIKNLLFLNFFSWIDLLIIFKRKKNIHVDFPWRVFILIKTKNNSMICMYFFIFFKIIYCYIYWHTYVYKIEHFSTKLVYKNLDTHVKTGSMSEIHKSVNSWFHCIVWVRK